MIVARAALLPSAVKQRINRRSGLELDRCDCARCHARDSEEDPYGGEGGDAGYVSFEQWTRRYVDGGKRLWGTGNCFDFCSRGICFGCDYNHPQLTLRVTAAVEARPKRSRPGARRSKP